MSDKHKRRWFQFSLRGMLVVVTVLSVPLARIAYLLRMADFHEREERMHFDSIARELDTDSRSARAIGTMMQLEEDRNAVINMSADAKQIAFLEGRKALIHRELAQKYRGAIYRPWAAIDESPPKWLLP